MNRCLLLLVLVSLTALRPAAADDAPRRPKVGLALGGGGAHGLAHLGVLRWLEQNHIPVDYIAGTSMGGLVAGMYAGGMTPDEIQTLIDGCDWNRLFATSPSFRDSSFRRKEDARDYQIGFQLGLRHGMLAQPGLTEGHPVTLLFSRVAQYYSHLHDFDQLPIPYRAVATDLVTAQPVVLGHGSLIEAMRATMAIPGIFTPVEYGRQVLVDGALLNNVPSQVVRDMGADLVIAVDVGTPLGDREYLRSLFGVVSQSIGVMVIQNVRAGLGKADVAIVPDLEAWSAADYRAGPRMAERGFQATGQKSAMLKTLSLDDAAWRSYRERLVARRPQALGAPEFVAVEGVSKEGQALLERRLRQHVGRPIEPTRLEGDLNRIYGEGREARLWYERVVTAGRPGLLVRVKPKPNGPPFLNFGLNMAASNLSDFRFQLRARLTMMDFGAYDAELRTDVALGTDWRLATEYYRPLGQSSLFIAPRAFAGRETTGLYSGSARVADYRVDRFGGGLDLGTDLGRRAELRAGLEWQHIDAAVHVGNPLLQSGSAGLGRLRLRLVYDGHNHPGIPTRGLRTEQEFSAYLRALGSAQDLPQTSFRAAFAHRVGSDSMFWLLRAGTSFDRTAPAYQQFTLGGPLNLSAYNQDELRGSHFAYGAVGYLHPVTQLPSFVGGKVFVGGWYELGGAFERFDHARYRSSGSIGVMADTIFGPASLAGSLGEGGSRQAYFTLGAQF